MKTRLLGLLAVVAPLVAAACGGKVVVDRSQTAGGGGQGGSAGPGSGGAGGGACGSLQTAYTAAFDAAVACSAVLGAPIDPCDQGVTTLDSCGCAVPAGGDATKATAATNAFQAWQTACGIGCGKPCLGITTGSCVPSPGGVTGKCYPGARH